jgi:hypothetical protein
MPVDVRLGGGGCREENRPGMEPEETGQFGRFQGVRVKRLVDSVKEFWSAL